MPMPMQKHVTEGAPVRQPLQQSMAPDPNALEAQGGRVQPTHEPPANPNTLGGASSPAAQAAIRDLENPRGISERRIAEARARALAAPPSQPQELQQPAAPQAPAPQPTFQQHQPVPAQPQMAAQAPLPSVGPAVVQDPAVSQAQFMAGLQTVHETHQRSMDAMMHRHGQAMADVLARQPVVPQEPPQPIEMPDPQVDPGGYTDMKLQGIEQTLGQLQRSVGAQTMQNKMELAKAKVRARLESFEAPGDLRPFAGRPAIAEAYEYRVMNDLVSGNGLGSLNEDAMIDESVQRYGGSVAQEVGSYTVPAPAAPVASDPGAQAAAQIAVNQSVSHAPTPMAPAVSEQLQQPVPFQYNHGDFEQRQSRARQDLERLAAELGSDY